MIFNEMNGGFMQNITDDILAKEKLPIPVAYEWKFHFLSITMVLKDKYNNLWLVDLEKDGGQWYFGGGWRDFASDNKLVAGDTDCFSPNAPTVFDVIIMGSNKCSKEGVGSLKIAIVKDEVVEMPDQFNNGIENCGESEETSNQISEEIGYCGGRLDDIGEEDELVPVSRKSKAKFQPKLKACGASSSRADAAPVVGLPNNNQPRRTSTRYVKPNKKYDSESWTT